MSTSSTRIAELAVVELVVGRVAKSHGIKGEIVRAVDEALADGSEDIRGLQQVVRRTVGRWVNNTYRRRPMILPVVVAA